MSGLLLDVAVQPSSVGPPVRAARYLRGGPQVGAAATEGARGARLAVPQSPPQPPGAALSLPCPRLPPPPPISAPHPLPPPPPLAPLSPARPRSARAPLRCRGSRSPGVRPAEPSPGGHGDAPGLPTFGLGASAPPAAPRRLPAPPGAQRFRAPRTRIPAGGRGHGVLGAGVGSWVTDSCVLWGWEPSRDFGVPEAARAWRSRTWRFPWEPP